MTPEIHYCATTTTVPNSRLPVLIYRNALVEPRTEESIRQQIERNAWDHRGTWGGIPRHHFHPNTHEAYAVCGGSSTLSLGSSPGEEQKLTVDVGVGDLIVLPAGVSHCSLEWTKDYRYLGFYPSDAPRWKNEYCKDPDRLSELVTEASAVPVPACDPVNGRVGGLVDIWNST